MSRNVIKKAGRKKPDKENVPDLLSNSLLENILGDNINNVLVGRRSDVGKRSLCLVDTDESIGDVVNNDELEKEERKREEQERAERERTAAAKARHSGIRILASLSQEELDNHYFKCIEMCNKNKVNVKNAFKLQLIDYMRLLLSNQSAKSENLTLMSCTLGASAKIYGLRVDKVYTDMVKILSGKAVELEADDSAGEDNGEAADGEGDEMGKKKKRGKNNQHCSDDEDGEEDVNYTAMLQTEEQLGKGKKAGGNEEPQNEMEVIPKGLEYFLECRTLDPDSRLALNPPLFSTSQDFERSSASSSLPIDEPFYSGTFVRLNPSEYIADFKTLRRSFSLMDEKEGDEETSDFMNSSLAFDPSTNIPESIRIDTDDHEMDYCDDGGGMLEAPCPDYDEDEVPLPPELPTDSMADSTGASRGAKPAARSFTAGAMSKLVSVNSGDYSFFDHSRIDFLAGPRHWTIKRPRGDEKVSRPGEPPAKRTVKKSCAMCYSYEKVKEVRKYYGEWVDAVLARRTLSTWSTRKHKALQEINYTQKNLLSLMKNENLAYIKKDLSTNMICCADLKIEEDTMLSPEDFGMGLDPGQMDDDDDDHHNDDHHGDGGGGNDSCVLPSLTSFQLSSSGVTSQLELDRPSQGEGDLNSELVPAPQKVEKIILKYSKTQKRIDIKKLKSVMWDSLDLETRDETDGSPPKKARFSEVFSSLYSNLPSEEAAQLSFPIAFMALLHMANEKTLSICRKDGDDDITVKLG